MSRRQGPGAAGGALWEVNRPQPPAGPPAAGMDAVVAFERREGRCPGFLAASMAVEEERGDGADDGPANSMYESNLPRHAAAWRLAAAGCCRGRRPVFYLVAV